MRVHVFSAPRRLGTLAVVLAAVGLILWSGGGQARAQQDARYFPDTGFRIEDDQIWDYFAKRGQARTFGLPTSRTFLFGGASTQFFQRHVLQVTPGGVRTLNLLDEGLLPYTTINGSTFPAADPTLAAGAPASVSPGYDAAAVEYVRRNAPDTFEGEPVRFFETFSQTVSLADAFPEGNGNAALLPLLNLEIWGQPTSRPTRDPTNGTFVYLRFQRGIMHYDAGCRCTQGLLLADHLKALITGQNLPDDLAAQAAGSPLLKQYDAAAHAGPLRPGRVSETTLANAFRPSLDMTPAGTVPTRARAADGAASDPTSRVAAGQPTGGSTQAEPTVAPAPSAVPTPTVGPTVPPGTPAAGAAASSAGPIPVPGPPPEGFPSGIVVKLTESGKDAKQADQQEYADGRQTWYAVRYERPRSYAGLRGGPVTVYSRAFVARDVAAAKEIYNEQAALNERFPEAQEKVGDRFELNIAGANDDLGDEAIGRSACTTRCGGDRELYLHRRAVFRVDNMVGVIYTYGLDDVDGNTQANTRYLGARMVYRMRH